MIVCGRGLHTNLLPRSTGYTLNADGLWPGRVIGFYNKQQISPMILANTFLKLSTFITCDIIFHGIRVYTEFSYMCPYLNFMSYIPQIHSVTKCTIYVTRKTMNWNLMIFASSVRWLFRNGLWEIGLHANQNFVCLFVFLIKVSSQQDVKNPF